VIVGIDGADPAVIERLVDQGRLPNLGRLLREGSAGPLRAEEPLFSPAIWTTVATGVPRDRHGIVHFAAVPPAAGADAGAARPPRVLVNSNFRRVDALWNIVGRHDRTVGFVGWWATWPAEPVRGFLVSDRVAFSRYEEWLPSFESPQFSMTYPPELFEEVRPLVTEPARLAREEVERLVPLTDAEWETVQRVDSPIEFHWPSIVPFTLAEQKTYRDIALRMLEQGQPDLFAVYLVGIDPISHCFWHAWRPADFEGVPPEEAERFADVVPRAYELADRYLGDILAAIDKDTTVLVLSDHGFRSGRGRPVEGRYGSGIHSVDGVLLAAGPGVRRGGRIEGATVFDVAPTVLALLGIPPARDMPGRVLLEAFEQEVRDALRLERVETHRTARTPIPIDEEAKRRPEERLYLEKLRALGYLR
jgi:predicted AlkP superfamily phosphohydrolase/phosphomutase